MYKLVFVGKVLKKPLWVKFLGFEKVSSTSAEESVVKSPAYQHRLYPAQSNYLETERAPHGPLRRGNSFRSADYSNLNLHRTTARGPQKSGGLLCLRQPWHLLNSDQKYV